MSAVLHHDHHHQASLHWKYFEINDLHCFHLHHILFAGSLTSKLSIGYFDNGSIWLEGSLLQSFSCNEWSILLLLAYSISLFLYILCRELPGQLLETKQGLMITKSISYMFNQNSSLLQVQFTMHTESQKR